MAGREGTLIIAPIRIQDDTILAPAAYQKEIEGGIHSVTTLAAMNAIPSHLRVFGMLVSVYNDGTSDNNRIYRLWPTADTNKNNNANWTPLTDVFKTILFDTIGIQSGYNVSANNQRAATVIGMDALARNPGDFVHGAGLFSNQGDAQVQRIVARLETSDNTPTYFSIGDWGNEVTEIVIPAKSRACLRVLFSVADTAGGATYKMGVFYAQVVREDLASSIAVTSETPTIFTGADGTLNAPVLIADTTNGTLRVRGTGPNARQVRWLASIEMVYINFDFPV